MADFQNAKLAAQKHLASNDPKLAVLIEAHGNCTIAVHNNYYQELLESIISQQLSVKAAAAILKRTQALFAGRTPSPEEIIETDTEELRACGNSYNKIKYMKSLAEHCLDGSLELDRLPELSNEELIAELTQVKGIGTWSAHMFMMFSLGRLNVLATGDLGIQNAVGRLYLNGQKASPVEVEIVAKENGWAPYETVACWYLWKSLNNMPAS